MTDRMGDERVGLGLDSHRFADTPRPLILGGVSIPDHPGLDGHSDADALTHAIMDALLGAAALGDIGQHFPPDAAQWRDADSLDLLRRVVAKLRERGYRVGNVDAVVVAERPRLAPFVPVMRERLAAALGVAVDAVSVKATTAEGMGAIGRAEGVLVQAIARVVPLATGGSPDRQPARRRAGMSRQFYAPRFPDDLAHLCTCPGA